MDHIEAIKDIEVRVPLTVPQEMHEEYIENYLAVTKGSDRLMLFAGDQRIEHLNDDFVGEDASQEGADPEHFFRIADEAKIGAFATQLGMIGQYAMDYPELQYIVKLNSKTNIVPESQSEPYSELLNDIHQVVEFKDQSGLQVRGVGYTIYLGSEHESQMLHTASQIIYEAHRNGLIVVLWIYPRGKAVTDSKSSHLIAGATGVANALGAEYVKVNYPSDTSDTAIGEIIAAAGRTKVIFSGGSSTDEVEFLTTLKKQLEQGAMGNATGRNIHQKSKEQAVEMCNKIYEMVVGNKQ